ncbi:DNA gyrase C-terminal beta-propeller domain-containing protein [Allobaculum sp. Allo2]|nr:DNA gyrase C-terminal beta-propeller domain-containing protein [Allobaculum sp. Allo2]
MGLGVNDELVEVLASGKDDDEILIVTRLGNGVRLETSQIPVAKGKSKGVRALRLQNEDSVLGMGLMDQSDLVIENSQGEFKRIALDQINAYNRPSKGDTLFRIIKSKPVSVEAFQIVSASDLLRFEGMQSEPVAVRLLTRKPLSSGWASSPKLDEPKPLIRPNRKLESGTRKDEEDTADEKPQLSLFDSVE